MTASNESDTNGAKRAVENVLLDYATAIDTKDWDLLRSCFTEDCVTTYRAKVLRGADDLVGFMQPSHDPIDGSLHRLSNVRIEMGQDGRTASATSYIDAFLVYRLHPDGPTFHSMGTYTDRLILEERWKITERSYQPLWAEGSRTILGSTHV